MAVSQHQLGGRKARRGPGRAWRGQARWGAVQVREGAGGHPAAAVAHRVSTRGDAVVRG